MRKFSVALLDDHLAEIGSLKQILLQDDRFRISGELDDARKLADFLRQQPVDLLFTDIHMPGLDGFSMVEALVEPPRIVFVSSYPQYAIASFDYKPLFFLSKPLEEEKILRCLEIAYETLTGQIQSNPYLFIRVNQNRTYQKVFIQDILFIESVGEYQQVHLSNGEKLLTYKRLKELIQELPEPCFLQIHRSYAINFHHLQSMLSDQVVMSNNQSIPVSRSKRKLLLSCYEEFLNSQH